MGRTGNAYERDTKCMQSVRSTDGKRPLGRPGLKLKFEVYVD
jgi:hypothetical protein